jgi:hypothetical protein
MRLLSHYSKPQRSAKPSASLSAKKGDPVASAAKGSRSHQESEFVSAILAQLGFLTWESATTFKVPT